MSTTQTATLAVPLTNLTSTAAPTTQQPSSAANATHAQGQHLAANHVTGPQPPQTSQTSQHTHTRVQPSSSAPSSAPRATNTATLKPVWTWRACINVPAATWLGVGMAAGALVVAVYYGQPMLRLARWTAMKDFHEGCVDDRSIGLMSKACNLSLAEAIHPPPIIIRSLITHNVKRPNSPISIAATIFAGIAIVVAAVTRFRPYLRTRRQPVVSMVRREHGLCSIIKSGSTNVGDPEHLKRRPLLENFQGQELSQQIAPASPHESSLDVAEDRADADTMTNQLLRLAQNVAAQIDAAYEVGNGVKHTSQAARVLLTRTAQMRDTVRETQQFLQYCQQHEGCLEHLKLPREFRVLGTFEASLSNCAYLFTTSQPRGSDWDDEDYGVNSALAGRAGSAVSDSVVVQLQAAVLDRRAALESALLDLRQ